MLLSIIAPTYNEAQNIEPFILAIKKTMKTLKAMKLFL